MAARLDHVSFELRLEHVSLILHLFFKELFTRRLLRYKSKQLTTPWSLAMKDCYDLLLNNFWKFQSWLYLYRSCKTAHIQLMGRAVRRLLMSNWCRRKRRSLESYAMTSVRKQQNDDKLNSLDQTVFISVNSSVLWSSTVLFFVLSVLFFVSPGNVAVLLHKNIVEEKLMCFVHWMVTVP